MPQFAPQTLRPYRYRQLDCYRWNPPAQHSPSQSSGQSLKVIPQTLNLSWRKFVRRVFACFTSSTRDPGPGWSFGSSGWISPEFGVFFQGCRCQKILRKILDCPTYTFLETFFFFCIAFSSHSTANKYYHSQHVPKPQTSFFHFKTSLKSIKWLKLHQDTIGIIVGVGQVFLKSWSKCLNECICTLDC